MAESQGLITIFKEHAHYLLTYPELAGSPTHPQVDRAKEFFPSYMM
jgi:hypothetical protein